MTIFCRLPAAAASVLLAVAAPAATFVHDQFVGTITSGYDNLGLFGPVGGGLANLTYQLTLTHEVDGYYDDGHGGGDNIENNLYQYSGYSVTVNGHTYTSIGKNSSQRDVFANFTGGTEFQTDVETATNGPTIVVELPTPLTSYLQEYAGPATLDGYVNIRINGIETELDFKPSSPARLATTVEVTALPEPATWAAMAIGFAFVGGALRRRRAGALRSA